MDNVYIKYSSDNTVEIRMTKNNFLWVVMSCSTLDKANSFALQHPSIIGSVSAYKTTQELYPVRPVSNIHELQKLILSCQNDC